MHRSRRKKFSRIGNEPVGYLFIAPFYLFFIFMVLLPIFNGIINSFTNYASAMSVVLLLIVCLITLINFRFGNQGQDTDIG